MLLLRVSQVHIKIHDLQTCTFLISQNLYNDLCTHFLSVYIGRHKLTPILPSVVERIQSKSYEITNERTNEPCKASFRIA